MASQITEIPTSRIEKLDKECHDSALDLAQDIARNLQIQTQSGASIKGDTGRTGSVGSKGKDGKDGKDGTDGITPTPTVFTHDLADGDVDLTDIALDVSQVYNLHLYWDSSTPTPGDIPYFYLQEDAANSKLNVIFNAAIVGDSWQIKYSKF